MQISEALALLQTIKTLQTTPIARQIKFGYMLAHNRRLLEGVEETYQTALKSTDETEDALLLAFEQDRIAALEAVAVKDTNGQPLVENNAYVIDDVATKLPVIEAQLVAKYPTVGQVIQERARRGETLGREQQDIALRRMPLSEWPDLPDSLDADTMNSLLLYLVRDDL